MREDDKFIILGWHRTGWMKDVQVLQIDKDIHEENCDELTNHQQRTTSTINEIVLMDRGIKGEMDGREGRG